MAIYSRILVVFVCLLFAHLYVEPVYAEATEEATQSSETSEKELLEKISEELSRIETLRKSAPGRPDFESDFDSTRIKLGRGITVFVLAAAAGFASYVTDDWSPALRYGNLLSTGLLTGALFTAGGAFVGAGALATFFESMLRIQSLGALKRLVDHVKKYKTEHGLLPEPTEKRTNDVLGKEKLTAQVLSHEKYPSAISECGRALGSVAFPKSVGQSITLTTVGFGGLIFGGEILQRLLY